MDSRKLPLWKMALLADPGSFGAMPANFTPGRSLAPTENNTVKSEGKKEKLTLYYTAIKTQFCADSNLAFSGGLATAYFRAMENKGEKIFLQGNAFLAKLARAVFEKDETLFAETCEASKDENYFLECAKALEEQGFVLEKGDKFGKDSWFSLFKTVSLLAEEYLATKCDLPSLKAVECEENSENPSDLKIIFVPEGIDEEQLKEAAMQPLELVPCSSDFLSIGASFFYFAAENFPYKDNENEQETFLKKIFDENVCKNLNPLPVPVSFATAVMEAGELGAYKDKKIYISHRLALDSLRQPEARFLLLLTLLHEYGHFLDDILHERAGIKGDSEGEEGKSFASRFMECSAGDLFNADFKFADFVVPGPKGEEQRFDLEIKASEYGEKQRLLDVHFSVMNSVKDTGNLKLPSGELVEDVEFWGIDGKGGGHEELTEKSALEMGFKFGGSDGQDLEEGCAWPDIPYIYDNYETATSYAHFGAIYIAHTKFGKEMEGHLVYESHFGKNQHWHSMCPKEKGKAFTNEQVKNKIIYQLYEWYNIAMDFKEKNGLFHIGKMLHTVQDSYCFSHCWRYFNFGNTQYNWSIWSFQGYENQNSDLHSVADDTFVRSYTERKKIRTLGYKKALEATKFILNCYKENFAWKKLHDGKLYCYLNDYVYVIHKDRQSEIAGKSHPWFKKTNTSRKFYIQDYLYNFSKHEASI